MEQLIIDVLTNGGSEMAFAIFLFWQNRDQQKRFDEREISQDKKETLLQEKYDASIKEFLNREEQIRDRILKELVDVDKRLYVIEERVEGIASSLRPQ